MNAVKRLGELQREALRSRLDQRASELRAELARDIAAAESQPPQPGLERDTRVAEMERDAEELALVTEALARAESAGFGLCIDCGESIAWGRLLAEPHAKRCLACAELEERRARSTHASL